MIFPTSSYLHRIWHDMDKRTFFARVHAELKAVTFNWSNHSAAVGNCVQYMQQTFHPFFFFDKALSILYNRVMFTHHSAHAKYISMGQKKKCECGVSTPAIPRERKMQSEIKCDPCCSSSNWYSDFYSEIYSCRPFHRHCPIDKASDTHRHGAVIVQSKGGGRTWRENWPFAQTASTLTLRPVFHSSFIALLWRTAPRGEKKFTNFRLRYGHDIYLLVMYLYIWNNDSHVSYSCEVL